MKRNVLNSLLGKEKIRILVRAEYPTQEELVDAVGERLTNRELLDLLDRHGDRMEGAE